MSNGSESTAVRGGAWPRMVPDGESRPVVRLSGPRRRRGRMALGVLLVAGSAVVGGLWTASAAGRQPVLALARPVAAGQPLGPADLRVVLLAGGGEVGAVPAADQAAVVGRPAVVPLPAGLLLTRGVLGRPAWPPPGQAVVAVAVKPGQAPAELTAGARVGLVTLPGQADAAADQATAGAAGRVAVGVVVAVAEPGDAAADRVLSVLVADPVADRVAAAAAGGQLAVIGLAG